jgi:hypothetical protein
MGDGSYGIIMSGKWGMAHTVLNCFLELVGWGGKNDKQKKQKKRTWIVVRKAAPLGTLCLSYRIVPCRVSASCCWWTVLRIRSIWRQFCIVETVIPMNPVTKNVFVHTSRNIRPSTVKITISAQTNALQNSTTNCKMRTLVRSFVSSRAKTRSTSGIVVMPYS